MNKVSVYTYSTAAFYLLSKTHTGRKVVQEINLPSLYFKERRRMSDEAHREYGGNQEVKVKSFANILLRPLEDDVNNKLVQLINPF